MTRKFGVSGLFVSGLFLAAWSLCLTGNPASPFRIGGAARAEESADAAGAARRGPHGHPGGHPHGPPQEALDACSGLAESDACTVSLGEHTLQGTCRASSGPDGGALACAPKGPPPGGPGGPHGGRPPHGPPPEAVAACSGLSDSAACSVTLGSRTLQGTCRAAPGPDGGTLACMPAPPPR